MKPILFISHDASRTGAPLILLTFCRWLAQYGGRPLEFLLGDGGDLEAEFAALGPVHRIDRRADPMRAVDRALAMGDRVARGEFALVYANTVETGDILQACASPLTPVLTHVHELEFRIREHTGSERFRLLDAHTDRFVAVSDAVRRNLLQSHGVDGQRVRLVHEFIDTTRWRRDSSGCAEARRALGIPPAAQVVGSCGTLDWRKGPELFVQLAATVRRRAPSREPVHWVWVGAGPADGRAVAALRHDAERSGVGDGVHVLGLEADPVPVFSLFDLFVSTSREDPFPLVVLEAAACGTPIVCFDGAGGAREFVEADAGAVVPYLDVEAMAEAVLGLLGSTETRLACAARAREKVRGRHDLSIGGPRLAELIEELVHDGPDPARRGAPARPARPALALAAGASASHRAAMEGLYRVASACASRDQTGRARLLFEMIVDETTEAAPDLAGKAYFKLATLDLPRDEALRCCARAIALLPTHRAAQRLYAALLTSEGGRG